MHYFPLTWFNSFNLVQLCCCEILQRQRKVIMWKAGVLHLRKNSSFKIYSVPDSDVVLLCALVVGAVR